MKIVINRCYGGFGLSDDALWLYRERGGKAYPDCEIPRTDPILIGVVEELGKKANNRYSDLRIVTIPDGVEWQIEEYDGIEWVAEKHRTWS